MTEDLWRVHQHAPFPASCLALKVDGVPLVKIDAVAGAILTGALRSDGVPRPLSEPKRADLLRQRALIAKVLADVPLDPDARAYFERLATLSDLLLQG